MKNGLTVVYWSSGASLTVMVGAGMLPSEGTRTCHPPAVGRTLPTAFCPFTFVVMRLSGRKSWLAIPSTIAQGAEVDRVQCRVQSNTEGSQT